MSDILDDLLAGPAPPPAGDGCRHCGVPPVRTCTSCGDAVCRDHAWTMLGLCVACADERRLARFQRRAVPEDQNWLRD